MVTNISTYMELFSYVTSKRCDCGKKMSFSYVLSPRLKPKHSATKMFAASEIAAYLTVFRCSKIAAYLTNFAAAKFPLT